MMNFDNYYLSTQKGFDRRVKNGLVYFTSPLIEDTGFVKHCITSRKGGVSPAPFDSLNFSAKREKNEENILKNYNLVARNFDLDVHSFAVVNYAHGYKVLNISEEDCPSGLPGKQSLPYSDGIATMDCSTTLVTLHADCLPLYFLDRNKKAITLCHAGWKGIYTHIIVKSVDLMRECYGSDPKDIIAAIGPSIGPCCFEVQQEVYSLFASEFAGCATLKKSEKMFVDLWRAAAMDMQSAGIDAQNVSVAQLCTSCDCGHFFSHRRDQGKTGAMLAFMKLI
jgi:YfiH family protein